MATVRAHILKESVVSPSSSSSWYPRRISLRTICIAVASSSSDSKTPAVLTAAGCAWKDVVKTTIFLADMNDFAKVNEVYAKFLGETKPARSTVAVAGLPRGVRVEIECVAKLP